MRYLVIAFIVIIAGAVSGYYFLNSRIEDIKNTAPESTQTETAVMTEKDTVYTLSDIADHKNPDDCWFAVNGVVYDVTQYIKDQKHPGKDAILKGCGNDASELYGTKAGKGEDHSDKAKGFLENFKIGIVNLEATSSGL